MTGVQTDPLLVRARAGDGDAFGELVQPYRRELQVHCYRMLGSLQDAEDLLQETLFAAWRGVDQFAERATVRVWLYRIATNRCLNALRDRGRRPQAAPSMVDLPEPTRMSDVVWLDPYPDALLDGLADTGPGPAARYELAESVGLAFVTMLQHLPSRQRAVLVLRDVLGFRAGEVAAMLETTVPSVKAALQRARATIDERLATDGRPAPLPRSADEREVVDRFTAAVERDDIDGIVSLLTDDAWLTMPPEPEAYQGPAAIGAFLRDRASRRSAALRLVPTRANGQPAFGCYLPGAPGARARGYSVIVLALAGERISALTWFGDRGLLAPFGLPRALRGTDADRSQP